MNEPFGAESPSDDPLRRAAEAMRAVRERCVWSQRITHDDLVPYLVEESAELIDAVETGTRADLREELGDLLFAVVNVARFLKADPEIALNRTVEKFIERFQFIEKNAKRLGKNLKEMTLEEMDVLWDMAKIHKNKKKIKNTL